jgi:N-acetylglucosamine malate deacetylase 1
MTTPPIARLRTLAGHLGRGAARHLPPNAVRAINLARGIDSPALVPHPPGRRVVVLAPHPDDELIGCGGTLLRHLDDGADVTIVHVTSGERTAGLAHLPADERAPAREAEAVAAAVDLGLGVGGDRVRFLRLPDGRVGDDLDAHVARLGRELASLEPDLVYAPSPIDAHPDHVATTRLLGGALGTLPTVATIALYEVWTPHSPTHVVDITHQIDRKLHALELYESALTSVDYVHTARGLAAYRSAHALHGQGYAEAFVLLDRARFIDLLGRLDG